MQSLTCLSVIYSEPVFVLFFSSTLSYIAFDFHKECSQMRWDRLQILVDVVAETQDEYRYCPESVEGNVADPLLNVFFLSICAVTS